VLAGIVAAIALAAPAVAAPANVTVRIEGESATLVPRTAVTTDTAPVFVAGDDACSGTSAGGALAKATGGQVSGTWSFDYLVKTIKGETHDDPFPADPAKYWSFWVNYEYQNQGLCATELQAGDDVLMFVDCYSAENACVSPTPLRIAGVPATTAPGRPITVRMEEFVVEYDENFVGTTKVQPAAGVTLRAGGRTATTGADGTAQLAFPSAGPVSIAASKPGHVRTAAVTCVTNGADGSCGSKLPPGVVVGSDPPPDSTAPTAAFSSALPDGKVFSRRRAPRELSGTVSADPSGLRSVRLSILRRRGGKCWTFRDTTERFKRHKCGGKWYFRIGDRAEWSYLLPRKLPKGRYTIGVMAVDKAFNESRTTVGIRVR